MQVIAFSTPRYPDWRWRIVNYSGETVEESSASFPSIATAVAEGTERLRTLSDRDVPPSTASAFHHPAVLRSR
jgi:hypothetical protein